MEKTIITRKIEIQLNEEDKDLRKVYFDKLFTNRRIAVEVANMTSSHLFALDCPMPYLSEEDKKTITYLGCKGKEATKKNAPYVAASKAFKGNGDMSMISCVIQNVQKMYQAEFKELFTHKRSLRTYKENMPLPFKADKFSAMRFIEVEQQGKKYKDCVFTLMGIPFRMFFGKDRSGNRVIVQRIADQQKFEESHGKEGKETGYKMCTSSLQFSMKNGKEGSKKMKMFLLLCVEIPKKELKLNPKKTLFAVLGMNAPILYTTNKAAAEKYLEYTRNLTMEDSGLLPAELYDEFKGMIGTKEEFLYRRRQIQEMVRRCQIHNRYTRGGRGRKRKCKAINHWHQAECNYIGTKIHTYSHLLVKAAIDNECGTIKLLNQKKREKKAQKNAEQGCTFVLRNWSYFGLKEKIKYKAALFGIKFIPDKEKPTKEDEEMESIMLDNG